MFLRWIAVLMATYTGGVIFMFGRFAAFLLVAIYAGAGIMIDVAPDKFLRLTQVHDHFAARGVNKPLWITEVGWSTCTGDTTYCVSESQQASYTATMFQMLHTSSLSYVKAVFLYHMQDLGTDQSNSEMFYGAEHLDGSPKPVWNTLKTAVAAG